MGEGNSATQGLCYLRPSGSEASGACVASGVCQESARGWCSCGGIRLREVRRLPNQNIPISTATTMMPTPVNSQDVEFAASVCEAAKVVMKDAYPRRGRDDTESRTTSPAWGSVPHAVTVRDRSGCAGLGALFVWRHLHPPEQQE
ncbi:hypothetical protein GCM10010289_29210 [Streptomyces violascens]|nr:hypothetical protein GCM10010289_29210 [Streptomyces violascens]